MVNLGELEHFLNDKSVKENDIGVILSEGSFQTVNDKFGERKILNIPVEVNSVKLTWSPGKIARDEAIRVFGSQDTRNWVGKKFQIGFMKMIVKGEPKTIIIPKKLM